MSTRCWIFFAVLLSVAMRAYSGDFDPSAYRPLALAKAHSGMCSDPEIRPVERVIDARFLKMITVVINQGETREIEAGVSEFVQFWIKSFKLQSTVASLYSQEVRVQEDGRDYWLPIQTQLLKPFRSEVVRGKPVTLYVVFVGCTKNRPVFLITEFEAIEGTQPPNPGHAEDGYRRP